MFWLSISVLKRSQFNHFRSEIGIFGPKLWLNLKCNVIFVISDLKYPYFDPLFGTFPLKILKLWIMKLDLLTWRSLFVLHRSDFVKIKRGKEHFMAPVTKSHCVSRYQKWKRESSSLIIQLIAPSDRLVTILSNDILTYIIRILINVVNFRTWPSV